MPRRRDPSTGARNYVQIADMGQESHGQARLVLGQQCVAFLSQGPDGLHYVNGMAQGRYPLGQSAARELTRSADLPVLLDFDGSAVKALVGSELARAGAQIRGLSVP